MKDNSQQKKSNAITIGLIAGLLSVYLFPQFIKSFFIVLILDTELIYKFSFPIFFVSYDLSLLKFSFSHLIILISPFIGNILLIESSRFLIKPTHTAEQRIPITIFQLFNVTWLLFGVFYLLFRIAFNFNLTPEWIAFFANSDMTNQHRFLSVFVGAFILFSYLSLVLSRVSRTIQK